MRLVITLGSIIAVTVAIMLGAATPSHGAATPQKYSVRSGDTLWQIATSRYPGSDPRAAVLRIRQANNLGTDTLVVGQTVVLP
jgi:nucleoid-associated protein YgaU